MIHTKPKSTPYTLYNTLIYNKGYKISAQLQISVAYFCSIGLYFLV